MAVTRESLSENFKRLNDDALLEVFRSGDLTDLAQEVAAAELRERGVDVAKPIAPAAPPTQEETSPAVSETPPDGDLVPIARFFTAIDAYLLKDRLEIEGVPAVVADANINQANPLLNLAVGGVRVLVSESQLERASEIAAAVERGDYALKDQADST
jgi:hypothetical protein